MLVSFPDLRVGEPIRHESLTVFPLFAAAAHAVNYELSDEAIGRGSVTVEEISEAGAVPYLAVENTGDLPVFFLEGEALVGAKQNRVLNTSVLVAAHTKSQIPVSCVEAGRWEYKSQKFGSSGTHAPSMLRHVLKASVSKSVRERQGHRSDQGEVWAEVARQQQALGAASETSAMSDTFVAHQTRLDEFAEELGYVEGAVGIAVAVGGRVTTIDLFDKPSTCGRVWKRLLSGAILESFEVAVTDKQADRTTVENALEGLRSLAWESAPSIGEGEEYPAEGPTGEHASALVFDGTLVHGSVVCGVA